MISRFDHVIIGVRDLEAASERYRALGFEVNPGGRHTGLGTANAIIRFGVDYIELLTIADPEEAERAGGSSKVLLDLLQDRPGALAGYALATADIEEDAERLKQGGLAAVGPFAMERLRPDGRLLSWRLLVPEGVSWRRPWPFLIQWDQSDEQRLSWEQPGSHPNGATTVLGVSVVVANLEDAVELYRDKLGLEPRVEGDRATIAVGGFQITLLPASADAAAAQTLSEIGEGPVAAVIGVQDLARTESVLTEAGVAWQREEDGAIRVDPDQAVGARLVFREVASS
jgi:catechol 2,3-dioxygenase-like lactoylglutathione lyase family enzyme